VRKWKIEQVIMTGVQFVTDDKGRKIAVQIDLKKYGASGKTSGTVSSPSRDVKRRVFLTQSIGPSV